MSCCPTIVNVPGPRGQAGTNGTNGTNGINSFTETTAPFFVPALGTSTTVMVDNTDFLPESVAGQFFVSVQGCGYMQVLSVDGLQLTLQNPAAGVLGIPNAVPTTLIPTNSLITLAGAIGPQGTPGISGGAGVGESYICRTTPATLTNATVLESLSSGYMKTLGSSGAGAVSTSATVPVGDISGTLPIAKGGTNLTTAPADKIPVGDGTGYVHKEIVGTLPIVVTNSAGNITLSAPSVIPFNYATFTRRVSGTIGAGVPWLTAGQTKNPFSLTDFSSGSWTTLDSSSSFSAATGKFSTPYTGYYRIDLNLILLGQGGVSQVTVSVRKNGSNVLSSKTFDTTNASPGLVPVCMNYIDYSSSVGETYDVLVTATGNGLYVDAGSSFSVQRIQA